MSDERFDLVAVGRSSIDLYSNDIGAPFEEITSFGAFVGGCPTNVAVGARRLGLSTALLTAVGDDPVGDFVLHFLEREGVDTRWAVRKPGRRTAAVLLGIQPPDRFPLVFYRRGCADNDLDCDDVVAGPVDACRMLLVTGTALAREPSRSATLLAAERARAASAEVVVDLDFRADLWHDPRAFGLAVRALLQSVDVVLGTEEEVKAAALSDAADVRVRGSQVTCPEVGGDLAAARELLLCRGLPALVVKRGEAGSTVHLPDGRVEEAAPFPVEVCNVLGAGDAFAAGFVYGRLKGWPWARCARMGNAAGAIVVTRQGCANFMPTEAEALALLDQGE